MSSVFSVCFEFFPPRGIFFKIQFFQLSSLLEIKFMDDPSVILVTLEQKRSSTFHASILHLETGKSVLDRVFFFLHKFSGLKNSRNNVFSNQGLVSRQDRGPKSRSLGWIFNRENERSTVMPLGLNTSTNWKPKISTVYIGFYD